MNTPNRSYWENELYNLTYDLIIIGAGLTGLSSAYFYKQKYPEAKVLVIDRGFFPIGASTRNAGFACIGSVGELISDLELESAEIVKQRIKDRYEGLLLLRNTLGDSNIDYEPEGGWEVFDDESEFLKLKDSVPMLNDWMEDLIGETEVFKVGTYLGKHSYFNRVEGMLHPGKMIRTLHEKCLKSGIEFRWNTKIEELDSISNLVISEHGHKFQSKNLIIATNAFTNKLLPQINIKPGRGYVFITKEMPALEWFGTFHYNKGYVYFRNVGDTRILIGGGRNINYDAETTSEFGVNETIKEYLINFSNDFLKLPQGWEIEQEWSGIMGFTESKSYLLEQIDENCILAAGLSGMGVALGMNLGKKASDLV
ncbi:MAG: FAD-dependent oxidoreductase [Bacteroidetes bacterium]|nr:FAD-dependent oxidoreductase [Bacteroidota bacterium]HCI72731.1 FAD-dependent oxidoreductase [Balneola sp.]|tara:strand:- start:11638 stop:12741 length:1104 start_codon:yes stop_codon:yes gene_type:complete